MPIYVEKKTKEESDKIKSLMYPVVFTATHDAEDTYLVYIPILSSSTEGKGLKNALKMAREHIIRALKQRENNWWYYGIPFSMLGPELSPFYEEDKKEDSFVSFVPFHLQIAKTWDALTEDLKNAEEE